MTPTEPLAPADLRWRCDPARLPFESTADVEPVASVVGQDTAVEALRFGLESRAVGLNVFVRGLTGTGRMTLLRRLLEELRPRRRDGRDRCYVHNFDEPDRPRLITLPRGRARQFRRLVHELADFIRDDLGQALQADGISARRSALDESTKTRVQALVEPFEQAAREAGLSVVTLQMGSVTHTTLFPSVDGKPMPPEEFHHLHEQGEIDDAKFKEILERRDSFAKQLTEINRSLHEIRQKHSESVRELLEGEARSVLMTFVTRIRAEFEEEAVHTFLDELLADVIEHRLQELTEDEDSTRVYRVNVVLEHDDDEHCAVVVENTPTLTNLLGMVDRQMAMPGVAHSDHLMIRAGSLLRADGGYLIMEARDVLAEPGAWKVLIRTLRSSRLEIVPPELAVPWLGPGPKPEPIDLDVKVVLLGDSEVFYLLDALDPDFPYLFKLLADFDSTIPRDTKSIEHYAAVLARIEREESLPPFDRSAVALLVEAGARIAAQRGKLTARFGRLADLAREGAFIANREGRAQVSGDDVRQAVHRSKHRAGLPSRRFREMLADGTIRIQTDGATVGQINGLAVQRAGPMTSGFPARITATIGPGTSGVISIEREAALSGAIHTKGFYILGGLLRFLLQTDHPLAFVASVAFEQSYGGIDGDSASGAEICCLLSALTDVPIRQGLAMTGAIDQVGHILAVGAVNEKIEGFFDTCRDVGLTGDQGVILPRANAGDLMLREDVVEACGAGSFRVHAVETVHEALEVLTGVPAGARGADGAYPEGSLLGTAVAQARRYWQRAAAPREGEPGGADENDV